MPGSPPIKRREPGTIPPPSTRLSSVKPVSVRSFSVSPISSRVTAFHSRCALRCLSVSFPGQAPPPWYSILCRQDTVPSIWRIQTRRTGRKMPSSFWLWPWFFLSRYAASNVTFPPLKAIVTFCPLWISSDRIFSESASSTTVWMARFKGRAPILSLA